MIKTKLIFIIHIKKYLNSLLIKYFLKKKNYKSIARLFYLNLVKVKNIQSPSKKKIKRIIVFYKNGGAEDLEEGYKNKKNYNLEFYYLPRHLLKFIYVFFVSEKKISDYYTRSSSKKVFQQKKLYINCLEIIFEELNRIFKFEGLVSFNIFYYAEKNLDEVCKKIKKKYIILHKESVGTPIEEIHFKNLYKKYNSPSHADLITVYSEAEKSKLLETNIAKKYQVRNIGCPRLDYLFRLKNNQNNDKNIIFYLIQTKRGKNAKLYDNKIINIQKLQNETIKYIYNFSKKYPDYKFILKSKHGVKIDLDLKKIPSNCIIIKDGVGHKLMRKANIIITFNSTVIFEAIAAKKNLIIPFFNLNFQKCKKSIFNLSNTNYYAQSENEFYKFLKDSSRIKKKFSNNEMRLLTYYLGNTDGKSGERLIKAINKVLLR